MSRVCGSAGAAEHVEECIKNIMIQIREGGEDLRCTANEVISNADEMTAELVQIQTQTALSVAEAALHQLQISKQDFAQYAELIRSL